MTEIANTCSCSDQDLLRSGASRRTSGFYVCNRCQAEISLGRLVGFDVIELESGVGFRRKTYRAPSNRRAVFGPTRKTQQVPSRLTSADLDWVGHATTASSAAKVVETYVSVISVIVYVCAAVIAVAGLFTGSLLGTVLAILLAVLLAVLQFVSGASIKMITSYIRFKAAHAVANK